MVNLTPDQRMALSVVMFLIVLGIYIGDVKPRLKRAEDVADKVEWVAKTQAVHAVVLDTLDYRTRWVGQTNAHPHYNYAPFRPSLQIPGLEDDK